MREIMFRGKRLDNGAWETGSLVIVRMGCHDAQYYIADKMTGYHTHVRPSTIGQYTGLKDKNGKRIFEGDIVAFEDAVADYEGYHDNVFVNRGAVSIYPYGGVSFSNRQTVEMDDLYDTDDSIDAEVIGNIHGNQELLKGGEG